MEKHNYLSLFVTILLAFCLSSCESENTQLSSTKIEKTQIVEPVIPNVTNTISDTIRAAILLEAGELNNLRSRYKIALDQVEQAKEIYHTYGIRDVRYAQAINLSMLIYQNLRDYENVDKTLSNLTTISDSLGLDIYQANLFAAKGRSFLGAGQLDSSEFYFKRAKDISLTQNNNNANSTTSMDMGLSSIYYMRRQYFKSLTLAEKTAERLRKKIGTKPSPLSDIELNIGAIYANIGELELAADHFKNAYQLLEKWDAGDFKKNLVLNNLGNTLSQIGREKEAIVMLDKVLTFHREIGDTLSFQYGAVNYSMGLAHLTAKNFDESLQDFLKTIAIWENQPQPIAAAIASCHSYLGKIYFDQNEYEKGKEYYKKSLNGFKGSPDFTHDNADIALELAGAAFENGETNEAIKQMEAFFELIQYDEKTSAKEYPSSMIGAFFLKSKIAYADFLKTKNKKYLKQAKSNIDKSFNISKSIINEARDPSSIKYLVDLQTSLLEHALLVNKKYEETFERNQAEMLLDIFETSKNLVFEQTLKRSNFFADKVNQDSLFVKEVILKNKLQEIEKAYFASSKNSAVSQETLSGLEFQISELKINYKNLIDKITKKYPDFAALRYGDKSLNLNELQSQLAQNKQSLIEYFVGEENIFILLVQAEGVNLFQVKKDFSLAEKIQDIRCSLTKSVDNQSFCQNAKEGDYASNARDIYNIIFAPLADKLAKDSRVIIVPDGVLSYLPFEVLLTDNVREDSYYSQYPYLLKKHPISYAYSAATALKTNQNSAVATQPMAAFVPDFSTKNTLKTGGNERISLTHLTHAAQEAEVAQEVFGGAIFTGKQATEATFKEKSGDYKIIILPTHAVADDRNGDYAFLAFQVIDDDKENELLYNREIYDLQLNADMVVLSACETGIGEWQKGEGIISLARGFGYAGAKSTVTSLWSLNDLSTQKVLSAFYVNLKAGMTKDAALRKAKLEYLEKYAEIGQQPYFWAGMIVIGDAGVLN